MEHETHEFFMREALAEARKAFSLCEVPIGAVVEFDGKIIGRGHNLRITGKNPLLHGELIAINEAAGKIGDWRLEGCSIFVTIEPCPMCAGAIVQARMRAVIFGARNPKAGCCGSILNIVNDSRFNHRVEIYEGVLEEDAAALMKEFFGNMRRKDAEPELPIL